MRNQLQVNDYKVTAKVVARHGKNIGALVAFVWMFALLANFATSGLWLAGALAIRTTNAMTMPEYTDVVIAFGPAFAVLAFIASIAVVIMYRNEFRGSGR